MISAEGSDDKFSFTRWARELFSPSPSPHDKVRKKDSKPCSTPDEYDGAGITNSFPIGQIIFPTFDWELEAEKVVQCCPECEAFNEGCNQPADLMILQCAVQQSDIPVQFDWLRDEVKLSSDERYEIHNQEITSKLVITHPNKFDGGVYKCRAHNKYGSCETQCTVTVQIKHIHMQGESVGVETMKSEYMLLVDEQQSLIDETYDNTRSKSEIPNLCNRGPFVQDDSFTSADDFTALSECNEPPEKYLHEQVTEKEKHIPVKSGSDIPQHYASNRWSTYSAHNKLPHIEDTRSIVEPRDFEASSTQLPSNEALSLGLTSGRKSRIEHEKTTKSVKELIANFENIRSPTLQIDTRKRNSQPIDFRNRAQNSSTLPPIGSQPDSSLSSTRCISTMETPNFTQSMRLKENTTGRYVRGKISWPHQPNDFSSYTMDQETLKKRTSTSSLQHMEQNLKKMHRHSYTELIPMLDSRSNDGRQSRKVSKIEPIIPILNSMSVDQNRDKESANRSDTDRQSSHENVQKMAASQEIPVSTPYNITGDVKSATSDVIIIESTTSQSFHFAPTPNIEKEVFALAASLKESNADKKPCEDEKISDHLPINNHSQSKVAETSSPNLIEEIIPQNVIHKRPVLNLKLLEVPGKKEISVLENIEQAEHPVKLPSIQDSKMTDHGLQNVDKTNSLAVHPAQSKVLKFNQLPTFYDQEPVIEERDEKPEEIYPLSTKTLRDVDPLAHFSKIGFLGEGKFGKVVKCICRKTQKAHAMKTFRLRQLQRHEGELLEVAVLRAVGIHPRISALVAAFEFRAKGVIVSELVEGGPLYDRIEKEGTLTEKITVQIVHQLLEGLEHLKQCKVLHCDLKPENLIMCKPVGFELKIIDFGLACFYTSQQGSRRPAGTLFYSAPETQNYTPQSYATDLWSVAVIAYELLSGVTPFEVPCDGDRDRELTKGEVSVNITMARYSLEEEGIVDASREAKDFIRRILLKNPQNRPTVEECLKHEWMIMPNVPNLIRKLSLYRKKSMRNQTKIKRASSMKQAN